MGESWFHANNYWLRVSEARKGQACRLLKIILVQR